MTKVGIISSNDWCRTSGHSLTLGAFKSGCILRTGNLPSDLARDQVNGGEVCTIDQHQISHATGIGFWNPALATGVSQISSLL